MSQLARRVVRFVVKRLRVLEPVLPDDERAPIWMID